MTTESQLTANRSNALASTGPVTAEGKSRISRNAVKTGLFSAGDFLLRDETEIYTEFCNAYQTDLAPAGPVEETFAAEIIHAAWRLRRCSTIEESIRLKDGAYNIEETQKSVERARAAAFRIFTRALTELRKLQSSRRQAKPISTKQTQSEEVTAPSPIALTPRGAPCTCGSGQKFKRCCGKDAPPLLNLAA
jgi:uncharacterized protein YecA (UPF0149 family)